MPFTFKMSFFIVKWNSNTHSGSKHLWLTSTAGRHQNIKQNYYKSDSLMFYGKVHQTAATSCTHGRGHVWRGFGKIDLRPFNIAILAPLALHRHVFWSSFKIQSEIFSWNVWGRMCENIARLQKAALSTSHWMSSVSSSSYQMTFVKN